MKREDGKRKGAAAASRPRKNEPQAVRARLLEAAGRMVVERGVASVTLDAVAQGAGVSKGGLLHHFRSKRALLDAVFSALLESLAARIAVFAGQDADPFGRFTRAYLMAVTQMSMSDESRLFGALSLAMTTDAALRERWQGWLGGQMARYGEMADSPELWIVQYAADGLWLADLTEGVVFEPAFRERIMSRLVGMTRAGGCLPGGGERKDGPAFSGRKRDGIKRKVKV